VIIFRMTATGTLQHAALNKNGATAIAPSKARIFCLGSSCHHPLGKGVHCGKVPAAGFESPAVGALMDALPTVATLMAACPALLPATAIEKKIAETPANAARSTNKRNLSIRYRTPHQLTVCARFPTFRVS
jgi:hypothetical protein